MNNNTSLANKQPLNQVQTKKSIGRGVKDQKSSRSAINIGMKNKGNKQAGTPSIDQLDLTSPKKKHRVLIQKQESNQLEEVVQPEQNLDVKLKANLGPSTKYASQPNTRRRKISEQQPNEYPYKDQKTAENDVDGAALQKITDSLREIHMRKVFQRKKSQEMAEDDLQAVVMPQFVMQSEIKSINKLKGKKFTVRTESQKKLSSKNSQIPHTSKTKINNSKSQVKTTDIAAQKNLAQFQQNTQQKLRKESANIPKKRLSREEIEILNDIKQVNSNIAHIYENIKNSAKKAAPAKSQTTVQTEISSKLNKNNKISSFDVYEQQLQKTSPDGAKTDPRDFKKPFEYSIAQGINPNTDRGISIPSSLAGSHSPRERRGIIVQVKDQSSVLLKHNNNPTTAGVSSEQSKTGYSSNQESNQYGKQNQYGLYNNPPLKVKQACETQREPKISAFDSQTTSSQKQIISSNGKQASQSTSKKIPFSKLKVVQTQKDLEPSQIYKFCITKGVENFRTNEEVLRHVRETSIEEGSFVQRGSVTNVAVSAEDGSRTSSNGVGGQKSSRNNSSSGANGRRRLIFQRQNDNFQNDEALSKIQKINSNRIIFQNEKQQPLVQIFSKQVPKGKMNKQIQDIHILSQQLSQTDSREVITQSKSLGPTSLQNRHQQLISQEQSLGRECIQQMIKPHKKQAEISARIAKPAAIAGPQTQWNTQNKSQRFNMAPIKQNLKIPKIEDKPVINIIEGDIQRDHKLSLIIETIQKNKMKKGMVLQQNQVEGALKNIVKTGNNQNQRRLQMKRAEEANGTQLSRQIDSMNRYSSQRSVNANTSVIHSSLQSAKSQGQIAGQRNQAMRCVRSVVQNDEVAGNGPNPTDRSITKSKLNSIKSMKSINKAKIGVLSDRPQAQKFGNSVISSTYNNALRSTKNIRYSSNFSQEQQQKKKGSKWMFQTKNEVNNGSLRSLPKENLPQQLEEQRPESRFRGQQESGMGVIASSQIQSVPFNRHKGFGEGNQLGQQVQSLSSTGNSIQFQREDNESIAKKKMLYKQKSHIVLSPIAQKEQEKQPNLKSIQLRSARNLPQLKSLHKKSPSNNIVKIHKITKLNEENNGKIIDKNWASSDVLRSVSEYSKESHKLEERDTFELKNINTKQVQSGSNNKFEAKPLPENSSSNSNTERRPILEYQPYSNNSGNPKAGHQKKKSSVVISERQGFRTVNNVSRSRDSSRGSSSGHISALSSNQIHVKTRHGRKSTTSTQRQFKNTKNFVQSSMKKTQKYEQITKQQRIKIDIEKEDSNSNQLLKSDESVKYLPLPSKKEIQGFPDGQIITSKLSGPNCSPPKPFQVEKLSQISSIHKNSSQKKALISKSLRSLSPQDKTSVKKFDLNFCKPQEQPSTKIKAPLVPKRPIELNVQAQMSEIEQPKATDSNRDLNKFINNLDDKFQLFSERDDIEDYGADIIPKKSMRIKDLKKQKNLMVQLSNNGSEEPNLHNLILQSNMLSSESIQNVFANSPTKLKNLTTEDNDRNNGVIDLDGLLDGDLDSNRSNSIKFIQHQGSLNISQKEALKKAEGDQQSLTSVQILLNLQKQRSKQQQQQRQQDISPSRETNQKEEEMPKLQFYSTDQQSPSKDKLLRDIEEEIRFNQQLDAIEIVQLNKKHMRPPEGTFPKLKQPLKLQDLEAYNHQTQNIMPPGMHILSPKGLNIDTSSISIGGLNLSGHHHIHNGILSASLQKSQISNFMFDMEHLLPPDIQMQNSSDKRIDQVKLLDNESAYPKHLLSNNFVTISDNNSEFNRDFQK